MATKTKATHRVEIAFQPTVYLKFDCSAEQALELKEIRDLSEFSDLQFLESQFYGSSDLEFLSETADSLFRNCEDIRDTKVEKLAKPIEL